MTADPRRDASARVVDRIDDPEEHGLAVSSDGSGAGQGGMASKLAAAAVASRGGCHTVVASGLQPGVLDRVLAGDLEGTWIPARAALSPKTRWIAYCSHPKGVLVTAGDAAGDLVEGGPLLAGWVDHAEGEFRRGDVVEIRRTTGDVLGRGVVRVDATTAGQWIAESRQDPEAAARPLVEREFLVLRERRDG